MTVQEMHIGIDLELQKINSFSDANIQPEEKDWFLNKEVLKYIEQKTSKENNVKRDGFHDTSKRVEDLRSLIKPKRLDIMQNEEGKKYVILPSDFYKYIGFNVKSKNNCDDSFTGVPTKSFKKIVFPIAPNLGENPIASFYINITTDDIILNNAFTTASLPSNYLNTDSYNSQRFLLLKALFIQLEDNLNTIIDSPFTLYWENYGEEYHPESFILIIEGNEVNNIVTSINGGLSTYVPEEVTVKDFSVLSPRVSSKIRVIDFEFEDDARFSQLSKSSLNSIIGTLYSNILMLDEPNGIIISEANISYICQPDLIDLNLSNDLNMPRKQCEEIVSNTVSFIKLLIESNSYQAYKQENIIIE